jgi:5-enolpyruvylshikimate-3-phosphate synthase
MDGFHDEESLAILDALEEDIHREKMIARQKTKGKRKLLNLKSSINYGNASTSSRHWKGKALMM